MPEEISNRPEEEGKRPTKAWDFPEEQLREAMMARLLAAQSPWVFNQPSWWTF